MSLSRENLTTELLYYENAYLREFEGKVLNIQKIDDRCQVILDRTAIYPIGGGQPADIGVIRGQKGEVRVGDVQMSKGTVTHIVSESKVVIM